MTTSGVAFVVKLLCIPVRLEVVNWNNLDFSIQSSEILTSEYNLKAPLSPARISNVGGQYILSTSEEQRQYQETWKTAYFFVKHRGSPTCLICTEKVTMHMNATSDVITQ